MTVTLILDTSTARSVIVFAQKQDVILKKFLPIGQPASFTLMKMVEEGLQELNLKAFSLKAIAVARGPGSYTGIRLGAAAAKGLAFPRSLPIIGFCSLEGFISEAQGPFASLIDARIGGHYVLLQKRLGNQIHLLSKPQLVENEKLDSFLAHYPIRIGPHFDYPNPDHLAIIAAEKLKKGDFSHDIELLYLRTPDYKKISFKPG